MEDMVMVSERSLRRAGLRVTPQRRLVLRILARANSHLDANGIYERGRRQDEKLSLSTVYRTLTVLKETGIVRELHLDAEHHHYELDDQDEHSHLVCLDCGRIIEVDSTPFRQAARDAGKIHGFVLASAQVELTGHCADCRRREQ